MDLADLFRSASLIANPVQSPYLTRPGEWVRDKLDEQPWTVQEEILESVILNRHTCVQACHASGKSKTASWAMAHWIDVHPAGLAFVLSTAPTDPQVKAILWRELGRNHRRGQLPGKITLDAIWRNTDGEIIGMGRKPNDYEPDAFQGIHQRFILIVIDEANGVPKAIFDAVETLATNENARVLAIGNPDDPTSHFATICKPGSGWNNIKISVFDTPNFTGEPVPPGVEQDLVSKQWVKERAQRWGVRSPLYISKVLGEFPESASDSLIQPAWLTAAAERKLFIKGEIGQLGLDVARYGKDETVAYRQRNGKVRLEFSLFDTSLTTVTGTALRAVRRLYPTTCPIAVDGTGLGAGVVDMLIEEGVTVRDFNGAEEPVDKTQFVNGRAEGYWNLREKFRKGEVDIDPEDSDLIAQLGSIKWFLNKRGLIQIESKEDYAKRMHADSPDRADAFMYSFLAVGGREVDDRSHARQQHGDNLPILDQTSVNDLNW